MLVVGGNKETKEIGLKIDTTGLYENVMLNSSNQIVLKEKGEWLEESGSWTSDVVDIGDSFSEYERLFITTTEEEGSSISIETRTSDDGIAFDEWMPINEDSTLQSMKRQFIQVRVSILAGSGEKEYSVLKDVEATPYTELTDEGLKLKRAYEFDMEVDTTWTDEGSLHRKTITREEWLRIDKMKIPK